MIGQLYREFGYRYGQMPKAMAFRCDLSAKARAMFSGIDSLDHNGKIIAHGPTVAKVAAIKAGDRKSLAKYQKECVRKGFLEIHPQPGINRPHQYFTKIPAYIFEPDQDKAAQMQLQPFPVNCMDWKPARWPGQPAGAVQLSNGTWFVEVDLAPRWPWELPATHSDCGHKETTGVSPDPQPNNSGEPKAENLNRELLNNKGKVKGVPPGGGTLSEKAAAEGNEDAQAAPAPAEYFLVTTSPAAPAQGEAQPLAAPKHFGEYRADRAQFSGQYHFWTEEKVNICDLISRQLNHDPFLIRATWLNFFKEKHHNAHWHDEGYPLAALLKFLDRYIPAKPLTRPAVPDLVLCSHNGEHSYQHLPATDPRDSSKAGFMETEHCIDCREMIYTRWISAADLEASQQAGNFADFIERKKANA